MIKINYQELREAAEQATQDEWVAYILPGHNGIYPARTSEGRHCGYFIDWPGIDGQRNAGANARYIAAIPPKVALALLDKIKHLEDTNIDATCRIAEVETNLAALVAENAGLKHAMAVTLEHVSVTDAGQAGVAAMIINDALYHSETPATDAFLAEVRAQGVEMYADNLDNGADDAERGGFDDAVKFLRSEASGVRLFADQLRKGGNQ